MNDKEWYYRYERHKEQEVISNPIKKGVSDVVPNTKPRGNDS